MHVPAGAGHDFQGYLPIDDNRGALPGIPDTESLGASYDLYLHTTVCHTLRCIKILFNPSLGSYLIY